MERRKINRRRPSSVDDAELGHFTLLFVQGRQRKVQRFITHVHSRSRFEAVVNNLQWELMGFDKTPILDQLTSY